MFNRRICLFVCLFTPQDSALVKVLQALGLLFIGQVTAEPFTLGMSFHYVCKSFLCFYHSVVLGVADLNWSSLALQTSQKCSQISFWETQVQVSMSWTTIPCRCSWLLWSVINRCWNRWVKNLVRDRRMNKSISLQSSSWQLREK